MDFEKEFNELLGRISALKLGDHAERKSIYSDIELYGEKAFGNNKYTTKMMVTRFCPGGWASTQEAEIRAWERGKSELLILIETMIKEYQLLNGKEKTTNRQSSLNKIFIVHGHDAELKYEVSNWLHSLEIEPIILHFQPNMGLNSILTKIEENSDVEAAIVLFTADDLGRAKTEKVLHDRARQNVVFEAGYFAGKLGPKHVIILREQSVELPSDLSGILYTSTDAQWKEDIRKELNAMGLEYKRI